MTLKQKIQNLRKKFHDSDDVEEIILLKSETIKFIESCNIYDGNLEAETLSMDLLRTDFDNYIESFEAGKKSIYFKNLDVHFIGLVQHLKYK